MANQINVAGPITVSVDTGSANALETLGIVMNSVTLSDRSYEHDVPGDSHGGPEGPPIDIQFLGRVVTGRIEFSKYDKAILAKIRKRLLGGSGAEATVAAADIGALYIQGGYTFRVLLSGANDPYNFPIAFFREPMEVSVGTKFSVLTIGFEAHRNQSTGVLWNQTTS